MASSAEFAAAQAAQKYRIDQPMESIQFAAAQAAQKKELLAA